MLFLFGVPLISCVAMFWRYLQIYAPSNVLIRRVRSAPPRWRMVVAAVVLAAALVVAMHAVAQVIERGAPDWLNLVVLVLAWDAMKVGLLGIVTMLRAIGASTIALIRAARRGLAAGRCA